MQISQKRPFPNTAPLSAPAATHGIRGEDFYQSAIITSRPLSEAQTASVRKLKVQNLTFSPNRVRGRQTLNAGVLPRALLESLPNVSFPLQTLFEIFAGHDVTLKGSVARALQFVDASRGGDIDFSVTLTTSLEEALPIIQRRFTELVFKYGDVNHIQIDAKICEAIFNLYCYDIRLPSPGTAAHMPAKFRLSSITSPYVDFLLIQPSCPIPLCDEIASAYHVLHIDSDAPSYHTPPDELVEWLQQNHLRWYRLNMQGGLLRLVKNHSKEKNSATQEPFALIQPGLLENYLADTSPEEFRMAALHLIKNDERVRNQALAAMASSNVSSVESEVANLITDWVGNTNWMDSIEQLPQKRKIELKHAFCLLYFQNEMQLTSLPEDFELPQGVYLEEIASVLHHTRTHYKFFCNSNGALLDKLTTFLIAPPQRELCITLFENAFTLLSPAELVSVWENIELESDRDLAELKKIALRPLLKHYAARHRNDPVRAYVDVLARRDKLAQPKSISDALLTVLKLQPEAELSDQVEAQLQILVPMCAPACQRDILQRWLEEKQLPVVAFSTYLRLFAHAETVTHPLELLEEASASCSEANELLKFAVLCSRAGDLQRTAKALVAAGTVSSSDATDEAIDQVCYDELYAKNAIELVLQVVSELEKRQTTNDTWRTRKLIYASAKSLQRGNFDLALALAASALGTDQNQKAIEIYTRILVSVPNSLTEITHDNLKNALAARALFIDAVCKYSHVSWHQSIAQKLSDVLYMLSAAGVSQQEDLHQVRNLRHQYPKNVSIARTHLLIACIKDEWEETVDATLVCLADFPEREEIRQGLGEVFINLTKNHPRMHGKVWSRCLKAYKQTGDLNLLAILIGVLVVAKVSPSSSLFQNENKRWELLAQLSQVEPNSALRLQASLLPEYAFFPNWLGELATSIPPQYKHHLVALLQRISGVSYHLDNHLDTALAGLCFELKVPNGKDMLSRKLEYCFRDDHPLHQLYLYLTSGMDESLNFPRLFGDSDPHTAVNYRRLFGQVLACLAESQALTSTLLQKWNRNLDSKSKSKSHCPDKYPFLLTLARVFFPDSKWGKSSDFCHEKIEAPHVMQLVKYFSYDPKMRKKIWDFAKSRACIAFFSNDLKTVESAFGVQSTCEMSSVPQLRSFKYSLDRLGHRYDFMIRDFYLFTNLDTDKCAADILINLLDRIQILRDAITLHAKIKPAELEKFSREDKDFLSTSFSMLQCSSALKNTQILLLGWLDDAFISDDPLSAGELNGVGKHHYAGISHQVNEVLQCDKNTVLAQRTVDTLMKIPARLRAKVSGQPYNPYFFSSAMAANLVVPNELLVVSEDDRRRHRNKLREHKT